MPRAVFRSICLTAVLLLAPLGLAAALPVAAAAPARVIPCGPDEEECGPTHPNPPPQPPVPPFEPPPRPYEGQAPGLGLSYDGVNQNRYAGCNDVPHLFTAFSNDVRRGTTIYTSGITADGTRANYGFYDAKGRLVLIHLTQRSRDNCVIHHEPEGVSTSGLEPGYYYIYASWWSLSPTHVAPPSYNYGYPSSIVGDYVTVIRVR